MSRFRRLTLDEAKETFPLINEEARKALKGGCDTCENWKIENPGIVIYSVGEWEEMSKNGNWTVGAVCGEGLMVGPNTVVYGPPRTPLCPIHPHFYGKTNVYTVTSMASNIVTSIRCIFLLRKSVVNAITTKIIITR